MYFKMLNIRTKIIFLISVIFMFLSLGMFIAFLVTANQYSLHILFLVLLMWFGATSTLIFNYLLMENLPFLQKIDMETTNNYTVILTLVVYIIIFPIIAFLTLVFLFVFSIIIFIIFLINLFNKIFNKKAIKE